VITTKGKQHIKRYLAHQVGDIARSISIGAGALAENVAHTALQFETGRADIILVSYDYVNNKIVFKTTLPQEMSGKIYEVAIWSQNQSTSAGEFTSKLLTTFDSAGEVWSAGSFQTDNARLGIDALRFTPAASATVVGALNDLFIDLSGNSGADQFSIAYYNGNANVANFKVRFKTDNANYYTIQVTSPATGYQISTVAKSAATATGNPSWASISTIEVEVVAGSGGAAAIDFDGLRIEDTDTIDPNYVMVAREVLVTPVTKVAGRVMDIEFNLPVTV
jgi:hypothetical protein